MKRFIVYFVAFTCTVLSLLSCNKEYSLENIANQNNDALGILLTDTSNLCDRAYINGNYYTGAILDSSNYALIYVNVASIGKYDIRTTVNNGMYFRDSGYFYNTGVQRISLKGIGAPVVPDTTQFVFSFGNSSCIFSVNNVIDTTSGPKNAYFKLVGTPSNCSNIQAIGKYNATAKLDTSNYIIAQVNAITTGAYTINTNVINGFSFTSSGTFTQKGIQLVKIPAIGTPLKTGIISFALIGSTGNCNFDITVK